LLAVAQIGELARAWGEPAEALLQGPLLTPPIIVDRGLGGEQINQLGIEREPAAPALALAQRFKQLVAGDAADPSAEVGVRPKIGGAPADHQEDLLEDVVGQREVAAGETSDETADGLRVAQEEQVDLISDGIGWHHRTVILRWGGPDLATIPQNVGGGRLEPAIILPVAMPRSGAWMTDSYPAPAGFTTGRLHYSPGDTAANFMSWQRSSVL
jgi:hypothetical protein